MDEGARISIVSVAWRDSRGELHSHAIPFDQGRNGKTGQMALYENDVNMGVDEWKRWMTWLSRQRLIIHNAYHDLQQIGRGLRGREADTGYDLTEALVWDTMLASWIIEPTQRRGLEEACQRAGIGGKTPEMEAAVAAAKGRYDHVEWEVAKKYAARDAEMHLLLAEYQWRLLENGESNGTWEQVEKRITTCRVLTRMAFRGIGYDVKKSLEQAEKAKKAQMEIERALPFSPATPAKASVYFYGTAGALPHCVTAKGHASVAECCVRSLIKQQVPGAEDWARLQKVKLSIGRWYEGYATACGADGRLRTDFKQIGTDTFRFISQRINLQAIPHDYQLELVAAEGIVPVRSLFRAGDGYVLYEFDLAQAEARVAAKVAGCKTWLDMFQEGRDLHGETAAKLFKSAEFRYRQVAKRANFALIYDVGPVTFRADVEKHTGIILSDGESKRLVREWRDLYPEFPRANKRAERLAVGRRPPHVLLVNGRRRYFSPRDELHKAFNAVIQGSIAEFVEEWMAAVDDEKLRRIVLQIHDSLVVEIPIEEAERQKQWIIEVGGQMATAFFNVPMHSDAKLWK